MQLFAQSYNKLITNLRNLRIGQGAIFILPSSCCLRVKDVDLARKEIVIQDGKGGEDRVTLLPGKVVEPLQAHLERVHIQHGQDIANDAGSP